MSGVGILGAEQLHTGPKVTVMTTDSRSYTGWLVGNTADGGVEIEHGKNGLRWEIAKARVKNVSYWR